ncbi:MAG: hypothetical protein M3014_15280, partial [Chloroflexota bacterium]|nr:hypothetical protein [Chloroflexota bacterium]
MLKQGALPWNLALDSLHSNGFRGSEQYGRFTFCPTCNIASSVEIGIGSVAADDTKEFRLRATIGFINTATTQALAGCVPGVYPSYTHACQPCLVSDKAAKLVERPTMHSSTLPTPSRNPLSYAPEFFNGNIKALCLRGRYYAFADYVVGMFGKASLFTASLSKQALSSPRAFSLKLGSKCSMPTAQARDLSTGIDIALAVGGDMHYAKINTKPAFRLTWRWLFDIDGGVQVPLTVPEQQVGLALPGFEHFACSIVTDKGNACAALSSP